MAQEFARFPKKRDEGQIKREKDERFLVESALAESLGAEVLRAQRDPAASALAALSRKFLGAYEAAGWQLSPNQYGQQRERQVDEAFSRALAAPLARRLGSAFAQGDLNRHTPESVLAGLRLAFRGAADDVGYRLQPPVYPESFFAEKQQKQKILQRQKDLVLFDQRLFRDQETAEKGLYHQPHKPAVFKKTIIQKKRQQQQQQRLQGEEEEKVDQSRLAKEFEAKRLDWKDQFQQDPLQRLEDVLSIYKYPFLSQATKSLLTDLLTPDTNGRVAANELVNQTRLVLLEPPDSLDADRILASLVLRYPVYYGKPQTNAFSPQRVIQVLGYDPTDLFYFLKNQLRYSIVGPAVYESKIVPEPDNIGRMFVASLWGVNLESVNTPDYQVFVDQYGRLKKNLYSEEQKKIAALIRTSIKQGFFASGGKIHARVPPIGLGAFLSALKNPEDQNFARQSFIKALDEACSPEFLPKTEASQVDLCLFDPAPFYVGERGRLPATKNIVLAVGPVNGNLFQIPIPRSSGQPGFIRPRAAFHEENESSVPMLFNAWDSMSFIGNGGREDSTIDGYMVAGTGPGAFLPNSSYLHNPFFSTNVLLSSSWVSSFDF